MKIFNTSREIPAPIDSVFSAISAPERLARWWGPAGFTNTFHACEFKTGGRWSFVMNGPDGTNYLNENVFAEIAAPMKVVVEHVSEPKFFLTILLESTASGTRVSWVQEFVSEEFASRVAHIIVPSNEQNLDRLTAEVSRGG